MTNIYQPILSLKGCKKQRISNNTGTKLQLIENTFPFLSTTDVAAACIAFNLAYPMNLFKHRVEDALRQRAPHVIDGLLNHAEFVERGSIIIAGGSVFGALHGTIHDDSDLDIWCAKCYLSRLRKLLVSLGYVLSRIATRYGEHSSPLISHVEQYCMSPSDGEQVLYSNWNPYENDWTFSDRDALANGQILINYALRNVDCNNALQFSSEDRHQLPLRYDARVWRSFYNGMKVDIIVAESHTTPEEVIIHSFDLTACQTRLIIGSDLRIEFPLLTLANETLLCPSEDRIVMTNYMYRIVYLSRLPTQAAIDKYGKVPSWFVPFFNRHITQVLLTLEDTVGTGGVFSSSLDLYSYSWLNTSYRNNQEFRQTLWSVVYNVRHCMIVDALKHVAALRLGIVKRPTFRYDRDASHDWAIRSHNYICHPTNVLRFRKYASRNLTMRQIVNMGNPHNVEVVRTLQEWAVPEWADIIGPIENPMKED